MRATRYLWISNLPVRTSEQDVRDALQSHGKIQSVRIHSAESTCNAVVAFVDTKSATRAIESTVRLNKTKLSLQYCESSGVPGNTAQDTVNDSGVNSHTCSSEIQSEDVQFPVENRSASGMSDSGSSTQERRKKSKLSSHRSGTPRASLNGSVMSTASNASTGRYDGEQRGLHIRHLPLRSSDTNLREGLFHEYKKHGKITSVVIRGQGEDRYCIITFKRPEDAERALEVSRGKVFFGTPISVSLHEGIDCEDPDLCPPEHALDEYHPKATKTLFVGNLCSSTITQDELRRTFRVYGEIIEIDIKIQANQPGTSYAFVQFSDIKSVVRALTNQESIRVSGKQVKLGFGKSQPTNVVWLDNLAPTINESFLARQFGRYGHLTHVVLDRKSLRALLYFDTVEMAQRALNETRNRALIGRKVQLDYAGYECQVAFVRRLAKHDGFSQVYDNYRERIQEMLSLWPSYGNVLPLLERQRYFTDVDKDSSHISSDECGHSATSRRSASRRTHRSDRVSLEYPNGKMRTDQTDPPRKRSQGARDLFASGLTRHSVSGKDSTLENSLSPSSDTHSKSRSRRLHSHSARHKFSGNESPENQGTILTSPTRRNSSQTRSSYCETNYRATHPSSLSSKPMRTVHANSVSHLSTRKPSHYLDETDEVSSGSLSPDLEPDGSNSDTSLVEHDSHHKTQRCSSSAVPKEAMTTKHRTPTGACNVKAFTSSRAESTPGDPTYHHSRKSHVKPHRDSHSPGTVTTKKVRPVDPTQSSRVHYRLHTQPQPNSLRASPHGSVTRDFVDRPLSRSPSQEVYPEPRLKRPVRVSGGSYDVKAERTSRSRESHSRCSYHSDEKSSLSAPQTTTVCSESHDTLTKLELERAKLLRELSMLNSEVGGSHKSKISTKKRAPSDIPDDVYAPKIKRLDPLQNSNAADGSTHSPMIISNSVCNNGNRNASAKVDNYSTNSCANQIVASSNRSSPISRPSNGFQSSSSEPGDLLSPVTDGPSLTPIGSASMYQKLTTRSSAHAVEHRSPPIPVSVGPCLSTSRRPTLITSSPRLIMPPEPTSPLNRLSSPDSPEPSADVPSTIDGSVPSTSSSNQFMSPDSAPCLSRRSVLSPSSSQFASNLPLRDPRLAAHQTHTIADIPPPPPPPPPECLKLPLWVDTSQLNSHSVNRIPPPPSAPRPSSSASTVRFDWRSGPCFESETEANSSQEAVNCSLDERIRLLDAQLLKSEKARPAVDYSKFRIRRKVESSVSGTVTLPVSSPPAISTPLQSTLQVSPITELNSVYQSRVERVYVSECTPTTSVLTATQTVSYSSPRLHCSTSPLPLPRLADTSEFVKSMLSSSKPSPSNPTEHVAILPLESAPSRQLNRHPIIPVSSPISSSIPSESVGKTSSVSGASHTPSSFSARQFGPLNARLLPPGGSSLSGTQPIGVATRLPSVQTFHPDSTPRSSSNDGVSTSEVGYVKSILKKDNCNSTSCDVATLKQLGSKQSSQEMGSTNVQSLTEFSSSAGPLTTVNYKKNTIDHVDQKLEKSTEASSKTVSTSEASRSTNVSLSKPIRQLSSDGKKSNILVQPGPKVKSSKPEVTGSSTGTSKSSKPETPRPVLDDSVFKTSLETAGNRNEKLKRNRLESHMPPSHRKGRPSMRLTKTQETPMAYKTEGQRKGSAVALESSTSTQKTTIETIKRAAESNTSNNVIERTPLFEKHKYKPLHNEKRNSASDPQNKENKTSRTQVKSRMEGSRVSVQNKRKARETRKRLLDSDGSDDENRSSNAAEVVTPLLGGYESMYDKIKRRANKDGCGEKPLEKSGILQRFLNARNKTGKRPLKRTKRGSELSPVDSDTDECLSGVSSASDDANNKLKGQRTKASKLSKRPERLLQRKSAGSKHKNVRMWSAMSCIKNNKSDYDLEVRKGKTSRASVSSKRAKKQRETPKCASGLDSDENSEKTKQKSFEPTRINTKTTYRNCSRIINNRSSLKKRVKQVANNKSGDTDAKHLTTTLNKKPKSVNKPSESHRSLVHRVFASTDSETPSLSSSETEVEDNENASDRSDQRQSCSASSTPRLSRSCSPDDLDADAAVRHTFGAFTMPVNSVTKKTNISPVIVPDASAALKCASSPESHLTKSLPDGVQLMSKSTPPTLPMLDSSSSVDHLTEPQHTSRARDSTEWNIFSSLTSQPIPVIEPYPRASTPTAMLTNSNENLYSAQRELGIEKSVSDLEDELPSLEKHDDDDSSKLDAGSLLLNDSTSLLNPNHVTNNAVDDDLPPPVVSAVGYLSPSLPIVEHDIEKKALVPDVIEEVVYDSLEVPVVSCEQPCEAIGGRSLKLDPSVGGTGIVLEPDVVMLPDPNNQKRDVSYATPVISACSPGAISGDVLGSSDSIEDSGASKPTKPHVLSVSSAPLSLPSTVYTPIAMLTSASQSDDFSGVPQPLLVTVPGSTAGVGFASSGLTLLPAALPTASVPQNKSAQVPRHVALILPATPISLSGSNASSTQVSAATSVFNTTTLVYNTTVANSPSAVPSIASACGPCVPTTLSSICVRGGHDASGPFIRAFTSSAVQPSIPMEAQLRGAVVLTTASSEPVCGDLCTAMEDSIPPSGPNTAPDPPDYTSYVQRVIERVKQEKDEEVSHHREKIKRPKKVPASLVSIPGLTTLNSATGNSVVLTLTPNIASSSVTTLTPIAPMPTVSAVGLYPRASVNAVHSSVPTNADSQTQHESSCKQSDLRFTVKPDPNENVSRSLGLHSAEMPSDQVETSGSDSSLSTIPKAKGTNITDREPTSLLANEAPSFSIIKSSIDEVIDAVLDGQFDESEYVEKIVKGTFDQSVTQRFDFHSPSSSVTDPTSPSRMPEESNACALEKYPSTPVGSTIGAMPVPHSVRPSDAADGSSPSSMFTPMHVLTFVAANAAAPQKITSIVTASSSASQTPNTSVLPTPASLSQCNGITEPQNSITDPFPPGTLSSGVNLATSVSLPVTGMEQLAAQFPNIPLTSYFYSLLARQQMNTSPNPPITSTESTSCKLTDSVLPVHVSTTLQTSLKGLNIPGTGDRADYLAAAAMAAMAAMASPTSVRSMTPLETQVSTSGMLDSVTYTHSNDGQSHSTHTIEIPIIQDYPVSWRGRLSLKNEEVHVQMHYLSGNQDLLKACLGVIAEQQSMTTNTVGTTFEDGLEAAITQPLKIVQRMRLEPSQLEGVQRKLRQANDFCMCLTLATSPPGVPETSVASETARMNQVLCDGFIKYMVDKSAAGIINVCHPSTQQNLFVIHIFPPCDFSRGQLDGCTPTLLRQLTEFSTPHLLIVVTTV